MKAMLALTLVVVFSAAAVAQQQAPALPAGDVSAKDITAFIDALPKDAISDRPIKGFDTGAGRVTVYGVFRPKTLPGDAILHETRTSETYYILRAPAPSSPAARWQT